MSSTTSFGDCTDTAPLDPSKHVHFVQGMVLGVDDFRQEFAWHAGRHETIARDLAGYGTVSGLHVGIDGNSTAAPVVAVEPGLAVTPPGRFVRLRRRQCAQLASWLARPENASQLAGLEETPDASGRRVVRVYVRLRYHECLTDDVPIPGEPCRTEEEAMAASRIADSWGLHLSFTAPAQYEENAVRELVRWLKQIRIVDHTAAEPKDVVQALRTAAAGLLNASGPFPLELELLDPPASLTIGRDDLCACLRAALHFWTTSLRPRVQERSPSAACGCGCTGDGATVGSPPDEPGVEDDLLLAELWVPVTDGAAGSVVFDGTQEIRLRYERRPILLHVRMLQELVTCGPDDAGPLTMGTFATVLATSNTALLLWIHHPAPLSLAGAGAVQMAVNGVAVSGGAISLVGGTTQVFTVNLSGASVSQLRHGDRVALRFNVDVITEIPTGRTLHEALDQTGGGYLDHVDDGITVVTIVGMLLLDDLVNVNTAGAVNDNVLTFENGTWIPKAVTLALDDLTDVDTSGEQNGDLLRFDGTTWRPATLALDDLNNVNVPAPGAGEVLTFRGTEWVAEATQLKPHSLGDHTDVQVGTAAAGQFLRFDGTNWRPAVVNTGGGMEVNTGLIVIPGLPAGAASVFGPFEHGFRDRLVMIRLAFETGTTPSWLYAEDTENTLAQLVPRMLVIYGRQAPNFYLYLQDTRKTGDALDYPIRWFAIPTTKTIEQEAKSIWKSVRGADRIDSSVSLARDLVLQEVAAGNNIVSELPTRLGATAEEFQAVLNDLRATKSVRVLRGRISLAGING